MDSNHTTPAQLQLLRDWTITARRKVVLNLSEQGEKLKSNTVTNAKEEGSRTRRKESKKGQSGTCATHTRWSDYDGDQAKGAKPDCDHE